MTMMTRSLALSTLGALALSTTSRAWAAEAPHELRIGYQKSVGSLLILKEHGSLEKRFASQGTTVTWVEFPSGPPIMEALHAGAIDFGYTGDTPPIFAQAAGVDFVYVASIPQPGRSSGILVRDTAGIKTLADLRGKKIAVVKGSSAHNVLVRVLEKANVAWADITPVYLQPPDAGAALQAGSVDAWAIWDPFYGLGERYAGVRVLTDAYGVAPSNAFFLATRDFATHDSATLEAVVDEAATTWRWAAAHQDELARVLSDATGVDIAVEKVVAARGDYRVLHVTQPVVKQQQSIADTFSKLGLLPRPVNVASAVWSPGTASTNVTKGNR